MVNSRWFKWSLGFGSMVLALVVLGVSLVKANRSQWDVAVLGSDVPPELMTQQYASLVYDLPESTIKPEQVSYTFKAASDWWWWRMADEPERSRRLLWLANQRLRIGFEMILSGKSVDGVATLTKAEKYLWMASQNVERDVYFQESLTWSVDKHLEVLDRAESLVPEHLRPRITELRNTPKGL